MRGRIGLAALMLVVLIAAGTVTSAAMGDTPPPTLKPGMPAPNGAPFPKPGPDVESTAPSSGAPEPNSGPSPKTATPYADQEVCIDALDPVVATPADLVTGNCENGWHIDTTEYDFVQNIPWVGGKMHGDYNGCGWIDQHYTQYSGPQQYDGCDTPSRDRSDYIYDSGSGPWIWTGSTDDGLPLTIRTTAPNTRTIGPGRQARCRSTISIPCRLTRPTPLAPHGCESATWRSTRALMAAVTT